MIAVGTPRRGLPIVAIATDLDGSGLLGEPIAVAPASDLVVTERTTFDRPGTYFIAVRATTQAIRDAGTAAGRVYNIARA
ncbi:hypothetical protein [Agromyces larvae]|uniref:DUF501 domain-containing protein n=1 Tax=Agromyces larvae TaxID=2929802 RepID=A0ABY4C0Q0_9MICO|nr:hypothetical protein [Agromyces larvae]UOE44973.1 hypothetical protein MTO99_04110 [Agromyces larvae]